MQDSRWTIKSGKFYPTVMEMFSKDNKKFFLGHFLRLWPAELILALLLGIVCYFPRLDVPDSPSKSTITGIFDCKHIPTPFSDCAIRFNLWNRLGHVLLKSNRNRTSVKTRFPSQIHTAFFDSAEEILPCLIFATESFPDYQCLRWSDLFFIMPKRAGPEICWIIVDGGECSCTSPRHND